MRIRVRMSEWETNMLDALCVRFGLTHGEYLEHVALGIACADADPGMPSRPCGAIERRSPRSDKWTSRTQSVYLTLGTAGCESLVSEARRSGISVAEHVARHATRPETFLGTDVSCESLDAATSQLGQLGITLNECARLANNAAIVAAREPLDEGEFWTYVSDCCECAEGARYDGRLLRRALDVVEAGLGGAEEEASDVHGEREGWREVAQAGGREGVEPRGVGTDAAPLRGRPRSITVKLSKDELYELDDCRAGLSRSKWVLLTCTPLYPDWRPVDVLSAHRLIVEMVRETTNIRQTFDALARVMEYVPEVAEARDDVIDSLAPIAAVIDRALPVVRKRINQTRVVVRD